MIGNDKVSRNTGVGVVPLRTILRNFLNLVESCEASNSNDGNSTYETEFQELKQFSETLKTDSSYLCKEGEKTVNKKKNRYKDILPFDYTRVILGDYGDVPGTDYINANFIKGASGSSAYIACQGPLPHTVNDFWRMVVECEVQVIVMACNEQESGKHKCENYWVEEEGVEREFGQVKIWLKKCRQVCPDFLVRTMRIQYTTAKGEIEERNVCQFHYSAWPDHGVPTKVRPLLDMVRLIRDCQTSETLPVLVHCSAGCGRTGTICAIDYVWGLLRLGKLSSDFSLFHLVREMRRQRIAMVQTKDQYILVHRAVKELFEEQLKIIDSHPYANVDEFGLPKKDVTGDVVKDAEEPTYETVEYHPYPSVPPSIGGGHQLHSSNQPSTSVPPIPPSQSLGDKKAPPLNSKLEKDLDFKFQQKPSKSSKLLRSLKDSKESKIDDITVMSSDDEMKEKEKLPVKKPTSLRNGLLRKPSIVKLKSFFEKSKDSSSKSSSSGGTKLSRAKSDVSSRFYTASQFIASSFHSSKGNINQPQKSPTPSFDFISSEPNSSRKITDNYVSLETQKPVKPPLLAKPLLPVKRSKSLRLGKPDSPDPYEEVRACNAHDVGLPTSSSSITNVVSNPIKGSITQVEIPEMKKPVSKSVKPEIQKAMTTELLNKSSNSNESYFTPTGTKPLIPPKTHVVINQSKSTSSPSHIKMGVAKEMEDALDFGRNKKQYEKLKKYDTVVIKSPNSKRTSLTRSQSHVWAPNNTVQLVGVPPTRIFSDENIHQTSKDPKLLGLGVRHAGNQKMSSMSQSNGNISTEGKRAFGSFDFDHFDEGRNSIDANVNVTVHGSLKNQILNNNENYDKRNPVYERPIERRRVPKTNPYANYTPTKMSSSSSNQKGQGATEISTPNKAPTVTSSNPSSTTINSSLYQNITISESGAPKDLPNLKPGYHRSRENSSESSSNTATPRSSLPSTPTQTIDSTYAQIMRSNLSNVKGISQNRPSTASGNVNGFASSKSKSILKGSLSSTPSESDERLDAGGANPRGISPLNHVKLASSINTSIITPPQKISNVRIANIGVRERRNSFKQAVCKEEQPSNANLDPVNNPSSSYMYANNVPKNAPVKGPIKSHKDYEPIWPEQGSFSNGHLSFVVASDDTSSYTNRAPLKPQPFNKSQMNYFSNSGENSSGSFPSSQLQGARGGINNNHHQRSYSDERSNAKTNTNMQPEFQSRFDEIKLLLEELKAPNAVSQQQMILTSDTNNLRRDSVDAASKDKSSSAAVGGGSNVSLRHQMSLRTPTRPQYPQGLSCFTLKKQSSLESLTDSYSFHHDVKKQKEMNGNTIPVPQQNGNTQPKEREERFQKSNANDYVSLRQGHQNPPRHPNSNNSEAQSRYPRINFHDPNFGQDGLPIAPPRAKRQHQISNSKPLANSSNYMGAGGMGIQESSSSSRGLPERDMNLNKNIERKNLPEVVRCSNYASPYEYETTFQSNSDSDPNQNHAPSSTSSNVAPTSPKHIIKALATFQAKAANMRSKLSEWSEKKGLEKERSNGNGTVPLTSQDAQDVQDDDIDGGFVSTPSSSYHNQNHSNNPSKRSTARHQYL